MTRASIVCLVGLLLIQGCAATEHELLEQVAARYRALESYRDHSAMTLLHYSRGFEERTLETSRLTFRRPGRIRREAWSEQFIHQVAVIDGNVSTQYIQKYGQYMRGPVTSEIFDPSGDPGEVGPSIVLGLLVSDDFMGAISGSGVAVEEGERITADGTTLLEIRLRVPGDPPADDGGPPAHERHIVQLWIEEKELLVRRIEYWHDLYTVIARQLDEPGPPPQWWSRVTYEIDEIELDPVVEDDVFRFTPPADAKLVDVIRPGASPE